MVRAPIFFTISSSSRLSPYEGEPIMNRTAPDRTFSSTKG